MSRRKFIIAVMAIMKFYNETQFYNKTQYNDWKLRFAASHVPTIYLMNHPIIH